MKTIVHTYKFDLSKPEDAEAYKKMYGMLRETREVFRVIVTENFIVTDGEEITLDTEYLFNNQWNTDDGDGKGRRVFDWFEGYYNNPNYKKGYWLEITSEMVAIRRDTLKCGYCGRQYNVHSAPPGLLCDKCLGSEYLTEKDLHLLRLLPVRLDNARRAALQPIELGFILPRYIEAQTRMTEAKKEKLIKEVQKRADKKIHHAEVERHGLLWLLHRNVQIGNCIYYDHTGQFGFGWRKPIARAEMEALKEKLKDFPYPYEIKEESTHA